MSIKGIKTCIGRSGKNTKNFNQTCLPQNTSVCTPNSLYPYFQIFDLFFFFLADVPPIIQNEAVSKKFFFPIIHLAKTECELTFSIIQTLHSNNFILLTSAKVVLNQRLQNTFSKKNAPCVLLSVMSTRSFLTVCLVRRLLPWFRGFFFLFVHFAQPLFTDSLKPAILEET